MTRLSPRGHDDESRELLMAEMQVTAVTARVPLSVVQESRCMWCNPLDCQHPRCLGDGQMACTAGGPPSIPTRRNRRRLPTLPWWKRQALQWQRACAAARRF